MTYFNEVKQSYNQFNVDASFRTRVSQLTTLMDLKTLNVDRPLLVETIGTGTNTFAVNQNTMSVTTGQYEIRQSKRFAHYFSGKSQMIEMTHRNFHPEANVTKRFGYFSSNAVAPYDTSKDGLWLESSAGIISLICSRLGTETLNVPITSWSGYTNLAEYQDPANWNRFNVVVFDFLWLGGAVLRLWIKNSKGFTLAHVFEYAGSATADSVFISSPNQPVRHEIRSTTGLGSFTDVCSQISTEGTVNQSGLSKSINTGNTAITLATIGTTYPIKAIRKQVSQRDIAVEVSGIQTLVTSNTDILLWTLQVNPTLSAALTYTAVTNSAIEQASGNGTITVTVPGSIMGSGYINTNSITQNSIFSENFLSYLGSNLDNTMDTIVLCGTPVTSSITVYGNIDYKEY
jgi:hypothetical protein